MPNTSLNILVAPLNWGLGHASRCIPIIRALKQSGYQPVLASDGASLALLRKEFPELTILELPSYQIRYTRNGKYLKLKLILGALRMLKAVWNERKAIAKIIKEHQISGIISDNRFGVYHKKVPSVFITHQLNVLSGSTTRITSYIHQILIRKFDQCWIPDLLEKPNLSGFLGHVQKTKLNLRYLGALSRFKKKELPTKYDLTIVLSGPEPQRTIFEELLINELQGETRSVLFVRGILDERQKKEQKGSVLFYNFMTSSELEQALNQSNLILARSGYSTLLDLAQLEKRAFFVPTPGQTEQEYLARRLQVQKIAPFATQEQFRLSLLDQVKDYKGFRGQTTHPNWGYLFEIFRKN